MRLAGLVRGRKPGGETVAALALIAFGAIPFVPILHRHGVLTGATGIFPADQLQYLAWIRDLSHHPLAHNSFDLAPSKHVFTDPLFAVCGALVRLGLSPAAAYLLWLPVAAVALAVAYRAYVGRLLASPGERAAALVLALFAVTPAAPILGWLAGVSSPTRNQLALAVADSTPALQLWGYVPIAITLALLCGSFLALERALDQGPARGRGRPVYADVAIAGGAGAVAGWLHPWQGVTVVLVAAGLAALERTRRATLVCAAVAAVACLPLLYYYALPRIDHAWSVAQAQNNLMFGAWVAPAVLLPLGVPALVGLRRLGAGVQERILVIWPLAAILEYALDPPYAVHPLESASLPLAILAVRGLRRLGLGRAPAVTLLLLATIPGLAYAVSLLDKAIRQRPAAYALPSDDARAIELVTSSGVAGGVLAPNPVAVAVPGRTGRDTWIGHPSWTPGFDLRSREASRFFDGRMRPAVARRFVRVVGARLAIVPCGSSPSLERLLGPRTLESSTRVGCARMLVFRGAAARGLRSP
ncbi:MAG: hypothetical protein JOZ25_02415 [Actinobacteria bacterium]|nr:hypothetical protein [Actinomycetota bacterium]